MPVCVCVSVHILHFRLLMCKNHAIYSYVYVECMYNVHIIVIKYVLIILCFQRMNYSTVPVVFECTLYTYSCTMYRRRAGNGKRLKWIRICIWNLQFVNPSVRFAHTCVVYLYTSYSCQWNSVNSSNWSERRVFRLGHVSNSCIDSRWQRINYQFNMQKEYWKIIVICVSRIEVERRCDSEWNSDRYVIVQFFGANLLSFENSWNVNRTPVAVAHTRTHAARNLWRLIWSIAFNLK